MPFGFGRKNRNDSPRDPRPEHAPGWDALDRLFSTTFGDPEPRHWATDNVLPAQDGPYGISAYRQGDAWFYVTYGLSDLFDLFQPAALEDGDHRWSGFGFELTMRVQDEAAEPPEWPVELLNKLGKYVYESDVAFEHGHRLDPGGQITGGDPRTRLTALAFANDPEFDPIDTPAGRVEFITVVGITRDELEQMKATSTDEVLETLRASSKTLVTETDR